MISNKPLKRAPELQSLSHDHHHGLQLCWKIRTGLLKKIELTRIKSYVDWFYEWYLKSHFELEEKYIFIILDKDHDLIKRALAEHCQLRLLFEESSDLQTTLGQIEKELEAHVRFEERVLFTEIQKLATVSQLTTIAEVHTRKDFVEMEEDPFWK